MLFLAILVSKFEENSFDDKLIISNKEWEEGKK